MRHIKSASEHLRAAIYDWAISPITANLYEEIILRLPRGARALDVGIGTAGGLSRNSALIRSRHLQFVGVDIDRGYLARAKTNLRNAKLEKHVELRVESILDHTNGPYGFVYFSASFMVFSNVEEVLRHIKETLLTEQGKLFIAIDTVLTRKSAALEAIKPFAWVFTTIDFGRVIYHNELCAVLDTAGFAILEVSKVTSRDKRSFNIIVAEPAPATCEVA